MEILSVGISSRDSPMHGVRLLDPHRRVVGEGGRKAPVFDVVHVAALDAASAVEDDGAADDGDEDQQGYDSDDKLDCSADEAHLVVRCLDSWGAVWLNRAKGLGP